MFVGVLLPFIIPNSSHFVFLVSFLYIKSLQPALNPLMKLFAILLSITVGILSVVLFREHLIETASALYDNLTSLTTSNSSSNSNIDSAAMTDSSAPQEQPAAAVEASVSTPRAIRKAFLAVEQAEGAGARVRRSIGTPQLKNFSPFLMLDHFSVKPGAGFPDHPHRGQEVCSRRARAHTHSLTHTHTHTLSLSLSLIPS